MYTTTRNLKKRRKRRLYVAGVFLILLAAAGGVLYRLPVSLQDISRIIQLAAGKFSLSPADNTSAGTVVTRGTIYDRNFKELAVSYQLFSLYVHPAKIANYSEIAAKLSEIIALPKQTIKARLKESRRVIKLADDLDAVQVQAIEQLHFDGVQCISADVRFYPEHTAAAQVIGFTGDGVGLSGIERQYDLLLQPGEYKATDAPKVDFNGNMVLGRKGTDLILTLDMDLQKKVDKRLQRLLRDQEASMGVALLLNQVSGRILALSSRPTFNPNYFWQAGKSARENKAYDEVFDVDLIRPLVLRAAARIRSGEQTTPLLPETVAAKDFGMTEKTYAEAIQTLGLLHPVQEIPGPPAHKQEGFVQGEEPEKLSAMQLGITIASLMNGGRRLSPFFLDSVYDQESGHRFSLRRKATASRHILSPAMGVLMRRDLSSYLAGLSKKKIFSYVGKSRRVVCGKKMSRYIQQLLFAGMIPRKKPEMLLIMAVEQDHLAPIWRRKKHSGISDAGSALLSEVYDTARQKQRTVEHPATKNEKNLAQCLISRRVDYTPSPVERTGDALKMPYLIGMSLRKGLQQLNKKNMRITVKGSGRIVAQSPAGGERLENVKSCRLTLESEI